MNWIHLRFLVSAMGCFWTDETVANSLDHPATGGACEDAQQTIQDADACGFERTCWVIFSNLCMIDISPSTSPHSKASRERVLMETISCVANCASSTLGRRNVRHQRSHFFRLCVCISRSLACNLNTTQHSLESLYETIHSCAPVSCCPQEGGDFWLPRCVCSVFVCPPELS